jgi:3-mercaptopyruvate sulfurtransferase SseA
MVVVYSDNGSKLSRCVRVSAILRSVTHPERVRRLRGGLNGWKRLGLPCDGDTRPMFAGQSLSGGGATQAQLMSQMFGGMQLQ